NFGGGIGGRTRILLLQHCSRTAGRLMLAGLWGNDQDGSVGHRSGDRFDLEKLIPSKHQNSAVRILALQLRHKIPGRGHCASLSKNGMISSVTIRSVISALEIQSRKRCSIGCA